MEEEKTQESIDTFSSLTTKRDIGLYVIGIFLIVAIIGGGLFYIFPLDMEKKEVRKNTSMALVSVVDYSTVIEDIRFFYVCYNIKSQEEFEFNFTVNNEYIPIPLFDKEWYCAMIKYEKVK